MEDKINTQVVMINKSLAILRLKVPGLHHEVIDKLQEKIKRVIKLAPIFDLKGHSVNGIRASIKFFSNWLEYVSHDDRSQEDVDKFIPILHLMSHWCSLLEETRHLYNDDGRFITTEENRSKSREIMNRCLNNFDPKAFAAVHGEGYYMRCVPTLAAAVPLLYRMKLLHLSGLSNFFAIFFKYSLRDIGTELSKVWHGLDDIETCVGALRALNSLPMKIFGPVFHYFLSIGKPKVEVNEHIVDFKRKYNIEVDVEGVRMQVLKEQEDRKVTFSVLKDKSSFDHKHKVLIYIHGGGFVGPNYSFNNDYITKDFCNEIPGLTVVNVKYSYAPENPFPHGVMDALDTYLWLTSGDLQVEQILGFHPQDIIISGDSSGGNLAVSLTVALNEIRLLDMTFKPLFPSSLLLLYPSMTVDDTVYPSSMLSTIDFLLDDFGFNSVHRSYIPLRLRDSNGNVSLIKNSDVPQDYLARKDYEMIRSPFISPVYYSKLSDLSDIRISVLALELDPILDGAIQIAKEWKGPVEFYFVEEAYHGPTIMHHFSDAAKKVFDNFVEMTKKALNDTTEQTVKTT